MSEHPILFSAPMVRALLDGRKTQTRRIVNPQPDHDAIIAVGEIGTSRGAAYVRYPDSGGLTTRLPFPYGQPGDRLWVRENCRAEELESGLVGVRYQADGAFREIENTQEAAESWFDLRHYGRGTKVGLLYGRIVPSIHMPRWASRITLEITGIRVERLLMISEDDCAAEGIARPEWNRNDTVLAYSIPYRNLWESIHGLGSWHINPWVWVVEFQRCKP